MKFEEHTHLDLILDNEEKNIITNTMTLLVLIQQKASEVKDCYYTKVCEKAFSLLNELL